MLTAIVNNRLTAAEHQLGVPMDYLREMYREARSAFFKFAKFPAIAAYRKKLPKEAHAVGVLVASRSCDCGPCLQIGVNVARKEGVSPEIIRAVLDRRPEDLEPPLADIYHFTSSVVDEIPADEETLSPHRRTLREGSLHRAGHGHRHDARVPSTQTGYGTCHQLLESRDQGVGIA